MTFLGFTGLINFISSATLAVVVFRKCPQRNIATAYGLVNAVIAIFSAFYFFWQSSTNSVSAYFHLRALSIGGMWINQAFLYFIFTYLGMTPFRKKALWITGVLNVFFSYLYCVGRMFSVVEPRFGFGFWGTVTPWFSVYLVFWHSELLYAFGALMVAFRASEGSRRNQMKYMLVAFAIGYCGGITNWFMWFKINFPPYANCLISLYCVLMAYAIVKHHLMDIRIIIRKTLIYSVVSAGLASIYAGMVTLFARLMENPSVSPVSSPTEFFKWFGDNLRASFAYSCLVTSLLSVGLGIFVWFQGLRKPAGRMWALTCWSIGMWSLGLGMLVRAPAWSSAYVWERCVQYPGAIMIPIFFLHFVMLVLEALSKPVLCIGYALACFLEILNAAGRLVSIKTQPPFIYYTLGLSTYWIFVAYFFAAVLYAHGLLLRKMFMPERRLRNQARYIFLGMSIGFCGGATAFFPVFDIPIFPYGIYAVPLYVVIVSYAIFKHQLMDINVVIRKTLLYSLVSAALASIYVGTITLLAHVLGGRHGSASAFSSALAAVFITVLFNPLRQRLQVFIDRKFSRSRLVGGEQLVKLSSEVIGHENLEKIADSAGRILEEAVHPRIWALYLRAADDREFVKVVSADAETLPDRMPLVNVWSNHFLTAPDPVVSANGEFSGEMRRLGLNVGVPLMGGRDILGYLLLGEKRSEEPYREEDLVLLRIVANQAAVAFERTQIVQQISGAFVHEIKMPLANISLPAELTFMDINDVEAGKKRVEDLLPKIKKRMKYIMDQARLASHKVEAVRQVSEPEDTVHPDVDLQEIVYRGLKQLDPLIRDTRIQVSLQWPEGTPLISGRPQQLEIVLVNLMKNAVEAMAVMSNGAPRQLQIIAHEEAETLVLEVGDTGPGIKALDMPMLFQSHWSTKGAGGMGVGLFLSRQIIQAHGGTLDVRTQEGRGTTFVIRLRKALKGAKT